MKRKKKKHKEKSVKITGIDITDDTLTSRSGLNLFVRYLDGIGIMSTITQLFGSIRKNSKGNRIEEIFKQLLCNFADGTSRHLIHNRGSDELIHRAFKDFGHQKLPFKKFAPNAAYYYCMVLAFFLFESSEEN